MKPTLPRRIPIIVAIILAPLAFAPGPAHGGHHGFHHGGHHSFHHGFSHTRYRHARFRHHLYRRLHHARPHHAGIHFRHHGANVNLSLHDHTAGHAVSRPARTRYRVLTYHAPSRARETEYRFRVVREAPENRHVRPTSQGESALARGWQELAENRPGRALAHFSRAALAAPRNPGPKLGYALAAAATGNDALAVMAIGRVHRYGDHVLDARPPVPRERIAGILERFQYPEGEDERRMKRSLERLLETYGGEAHTASEQID